MGSVSLPESGSLKNDYPLHQNGEGGFFWNSGHRIVDATLLLLSLLTAGTLSGSPTPP
jgi:hypothetical protein